MRGTALQPPVSAGGAGGAPGARAETPRQALGAVPGQGMPKPMEAQLETGCHTHRWYIENKFIFSPNPLSLLHLRKVCV